MTDTPKYEGELISFIDMTISIPNAIVSWFWNLGSVNSTLQNTTNTYPQDGVYNVTLTVTENTSEYRLETPINTFFIITNEDIVQKMTFEYNLKIDSKKKNNNPFQKSENHKIYKGKNHK